MSTTVPHLAPVEATSEAGPPTQPQVSQDGGGQLARPRWAVVGGPRPWLPFRCLREAAPRDHRPWWGRVTRVAPCPGLPGWMKGSRIGVSPFLLLWGPLPTPRMHPCGFWPRPPPVSGSQIGAGLVTRLLRSLSLASATSSSPAWHEQPSLGSSSAPFPEDVARIPPT